MRIILFINSMNNINNKNFKTKLLFGNLSNLERGLYNEISKLVDIPDVMRILDSSQFFVKEYLQQEFKQSSRFKIDKIHPSGIPLKESHEKRLKGKTSIKFSSHNKNEEQELQLSNFVEQKPKLRYFTMGSRQHPKQFERWSPEEMYNWWLELRTSGIPKLEWKILDAVFFLFINQISCICNSYIRYGIKNNSNTKNVFKEELRLLSKYFILLDEFYKSGGEYGLLIDTHLAFCFWFQHRIKYDSQFKKYVEYQNQSENIINLFNEKSGNKIINNPSSYDNKNSLDVVLKTIYSDLNNKNNNGIILYTSYVQSPSDYISLYSIPVITILGVPHKSHNAVFYSPFAQIAHDILAHSEDVLIKYLNFLYKNSNNNDIQIFRKKMIFLQLLRDKKISDAQLLLWYIIHEMDQNIFYILRKYIIIPQNKMNLLQEIKNRKIEQFKIVFDILSKYNNVNNLKNKRYINLSENKISNFFDIHVLLKQLKILKILLIELTSSEEKKESLQRILNSIDVLIETCKETINIVKNEQHNNYMRNQRNPNNI